ncbi:MAG: hypothetical protein OEV35_00355 [Gallionellaceae bacterium]|nr:hypothetical protein [Gallionellaceae bacterium]
MNQYGSVALDRAQVDISNCRVRTHNTGSAECMVVGNDCPWRVNGGRMVIEHEVFPILFCRHTEVESIAKSTRKRRGSSVSGGRSSKSSRRSVAESEAG